MARPSKLTPELREELLARIRVGVPLRTAAASLGICRKTIYNWIEQGKSDTEGPYHDLAVGVEQAAAQASIPLIAAIRHAARTNTKDAKWLLERLDPESWEKRRLPPLPEVEATPAEFAQEICTLVEAMQNSVPMAPPEGDAPPAADAG